MENIIKNLPTRSLSTIQDIEPKILEILEKHSLDTVGSSIAYAASANRRPRRPAAATVASTGECSWCRKRSLTFIGHVYTNCNELKKHKEQQKKVASITDDSINNAESRVGSVRRIITRPTLPLTMMIAETRLSLSQLSDREPPLDPSSSPVMASGLSLKNRGKCSRRRHSTFGI